MDSQQDAPEGTKVGADWGLGPAGVPVGDDCVDPREHICLTMLCLVDNRLSHCDQVRVEREIAEPRRLPVGGREVPLWFVAHRHHSPRREWHLVEPVW